MQNINNVLVDADACPVKDEIVQVGTEFHVEIVFVASYTHRSRKQQGNWIYVDSGQDEVDLYISTCKGNRSHDHTVYGAC